MQIICFPYAGASSNIFAKIRRNSVLDVIDYELPGRGRRINEKYENSVKHVVSDVIENIKFNEEYMIFGHSMGGYIAFELAKEMELRGFKLPNKTIISGQVHPNYRNQEKMLHILKMNDLELIEYLIEYGGTRAEVFEDEDLKELVLDIIRKDYALVADYNDFSGYKLKCNLQILYGNKDESAEWKKVLKWKEYTTGKILFSQFPGGHFFINELLKNPKEFEKVIC